MKFMKTEKITVTRKYFLYFLLVGLVSMALHELGHYVAAKIIGIDAFFRAFNQIVFLWNEIPKTDINVGIVLLSGPLVTIFLSYLGLYFLHTQKKFKELWTSFVLFNIRPIYILASLFFVNLNTHDEFYFFNYMGWNQIYLLLIYSIVSYLPVKYIFDNLNVKKTGKMIFFIESFFFTLVVIGITLLIDRSVLAIQLNLIYNSKYLL